MDLDPDPDGDPSKRLLTVLAIFGAPGKVTPVVVHQSVMSTEDAAKVARKLGIPYPER
jgi:hypothetical protein